MTRGGSRRRFLFSGACAGAAALAAGARGSASQAAAPPLKVGLALVSPAAEVGWTKQHVVGAEAIKQALGDAVDITVVDHVAQPQDAERMFRGLAASGHRLVYGTSFSHGVAIARVAPQFPSVAFDDCAGSKLLTNLGSFEARYHEGAFLAGVAAVQVSKTGKLGFIGGFAFPDIVGPANAFLLGAQSLRPSATCRILFMNSWTDPGKEKAATLVLAAEQCDVVMAMTDGPAAVQTAEQAGIWGIGYSSDMRRFAPTRQLTAMTLDWRGIYVADARDVLANAWRPRARWQGLADGVVKMAPYAESVTTDGRAVLARHEAAIKAGALQPFGGEIRDQAGAVRVRAGTVLDEIKTRSIDWLVAGMQGGMTG